MSLSQLTNTPAFQNHAQGLIGEFITPAGTVAYLMTKARLGIDATDPERRLTEHLVPVREVIPGEELDFNQLLQRDLDDHRVAVSLVPYLLNTDWTGPAFFPPIVAIALPFSGQRPSEFPEFSPAAQVEEALTWSQTDAGQHFRVRRLLNATGELSPISLGQVWWNGEFCKIVVIDGQHRAMALLAIDRTIRQTWSNAGAGAKYRYFYESRIKQALKNKDIHEIEVPVTLLWFPERFGEGKQPHKAARKLFVDVNKEARTPSESRLILLSDGELANILTRTTLTQLRNQDDNKYLPLYCVEYDNPDTKTTSARWSALTNIHVLKQMVTRTVFGPAKYINKVDVAIVGREPDEQRNSFMRVQLGVSSLFPATLDGDEPFPRDRLGNTDFPESAVAKLTERYRDTWSSAILTLLSKIEAWNAHARALSKLKSQWLVDDAIASLAHDALFSGVGMYWTLRDSATYWSEERPPGGGGRPGKPDVVKAWDMIATKQVEFEQLRAEALLGSKGKREASNQVYQAMNTHACQLGIALTLATLFRLTMANSSTDAVSLAERVAEGVNAWMLSKTSGEYDRRLVLCRRSDGTPKHALNVITNMDMPRAVQFRYFWLEILTSEEAFQKLTPVVDQNKLTELRDIARASYITYVAGEKARALKTSRPELTERERKDQAVEDARSEVRQALIKWFNVTAADMDHWLANQVSVPTTSIEDDDQDGILSGDELSPDTESAENGDAVDPDISDYM